MTCLQAAMALRSAIKAAPECCDVAKKWKAGALEIPPPEMDNSGLRMYWALKILRVWHKEKQYDSLVVGTIYKWIDGGMRGGLPWPNDPFFADWAAKEGYSNIDGFVGFVFNVDRIKVD